MKRGFWISLASVELGRSNTAHAARGSGPVPRGLDASSAHQVVIYVQLSLALPLFRHGARSS